MGMIEIEEKQLRNLVAEAVTLGIAEYIRKSSGVNFTELPSLLTKAQAAKLLNVSTRTIDRKIESGEFTVKQIGKSVRIQSRSILKLLNIR